MMSKSLKSSSDLALEIREVDDVEIDQAEFADTCRGKIKAQRRAQPASANEKNFGVFQLELPVHADFRHDEMAAVAQNLFLRKTRARLGCGLGLSGCGHLDFLPL